MNEDSIAAVACLLDEDFLHCQQLWGKGFAYTSGTAALGGPG